MAKRRKKLDKTHPDHDKSLRALYARMRKKFSAADLQKYTEIEEGIPAAVVIKEMETIYQEFHRKKR